MSTTATTFAIVQLLIGVVAATGAVVSWQHRHRAIGRPVIVLFVTGCGYPIVNGLSILVSDPLSKHLLHNLIYPISFVMTIALLYVALEFTHRWSYHRVRILALLGGLAIADLVLSLTDPLSGLYITDVVISADGSFVSQTANNSLLLWTRNLIAFTIAFIAFGLVIEEFPATRGLRRSQSRVIVIAFVFGIGFFLWQTFFPVHSAFNLGAVGVLGASSMLLWGLFYANLLEIGPIARTTLMDNMDEAVIALDTEDRIVESNASARRLFTYDDTAIGSRIGDSVLTGTVSPMSTDSVPSAAALALADHLERARSASAAITIPVEDGDETRYYSLRMTPIAARGSSETHLGQLLIVQDVTERYERETRLRELHTRLSLALEETNTGVWELALDSARISMDSTAEQLLGYEPGEFTGDLDDLLARIHEDDRIEVTDRLAAATDSGSTFRSVFRVPTQEGHSWWIQARGVVQTDADKDPTRLVGIYTDVTDRMAAQRRLEDQHDRLELLTQLVRHDISNEALLIGTLLARLDAETAFDAPSEASEAQRYVSRIAASTERIIDLTDQAKELMAAIASLEESLTAVPLRDTLERELAATAMRNPDAVIRNEGVPTVDVRANAMLNAVFHNLLQNAITHNDAATPEIVVSASQRDSMVRVTIADNGPGVPPAERSAVLSEGTTLSGSEGTGFGLYLVDTLVSQYGGRLQIADAGELGGAAITVWLPIVESEAVDTSNDDASP